MYGGQREDGASKVDSCRLGLGRTTDAIAAERPMNEDQGKLQQIQVFLALSDQVGTAGQPTVAQFADIKTAGYQSIVNLALVSSTDAIPEEREIVAQLGMEYVHIPVNWETPTLEDLTHFFEVMDQRSDTQIFVHCAKNMRVSAFMYLYRVLRQ